MAQKRFLKKEHASELPTSQRISSHEGTPGARAFLKAELDTPQTESTTRETIHIWILPKAVPHISQGF